MSRIRAITKRTGSRRLRRSTSTPIFCGFGPCCYATSALPISPQSAFQFIQGLETLPLRLRQHNENAVKVAEFLNNHSKVARVIFPKFQTDAAGERARKYLRQGYYGALVGFELKDGREAGRRFIDGLQLLYHVANIGDARSLAIHPSTTTHSQLSPEEQLATGVTPGYVRLSIGIEHPDDIIADIAEALEAA